MLRWLVLDDGAGRPRANRSACSVSLPRSAVLAWFRCASVLSGAGQECVGEHGRQAQGALQLGRAVVKVAVQEIFGLTYPVGDRVPGDVQSFRGTDKAALGVEVGPEGLAEVSRSSGLLREWAEFAGDEGRSHLGIRSEECDKFDVTVADGAAADASIGAARKSRGTEGFAVALPEAGDAACVSSYADIDGSQAGDFLQRRHFAADGRP
jgi:hypothetical protein